MTNTSAKYLSSKDPGEVEFQVLNYGTVTSKGFLVRHEARKPGPVKHFSTAEIKALTDKLGGECRLHTSQWYEDRGIPYGGKKYYDMGGVGES